ncbi:MAG: FAD-dependent oxidoreductase [Candidatus Abyssobacteria bacterium SURF_17]|uniref:FAD-dependent oxidoreductase n=1 Tax=Candidatus Abyssobacteria bacterium SURF_17 TaxID=2093361 RepID=A0A419F1M3_9BACT|nr:MAG: FAD-dependent oxidoreductase [Candidatus Abyssubacteria bacterium SURF_17]
MSLVTAEKTTKVAIILDGQEVRADGDRTILDVCRENNIRIPTLCHDEQLEPIGSCQMCVVELEGHGLVISCNTRVADGMEIRTDSAKVVAARKKALRQLLAEHYGDCVAPCQNACPAGIDIQGYLALIARGAYKEAVELIKERLPLPAIIGRICPHPCEQACRRNLVDEPLSICSLKRFAADQEMLGNEKFVPMIEPATGFKIAIVGGGPAGLSAAYYLAKDGHAVTIFEALPKPGGMLRYGIPDYRLPQDILDKEISTITDMGVVIKTNTALGKDFTIGSLFDNGFNAVFLAIGAHQSTKMNVEGENLEGVLPGTDFLKTAAMGQKVDVGKRVAVIGGGNTAIDAARVAFRMGAGEVTIVYRRSRAEMPATDWEVEEAEEEGVKLRFLAAPVRIIGDNGRVSAIECIRMALGEPDASGRRRPEPIPRSQFTLEVDSVIAAIGQRTDLSGLKGGKEAASASEPNNIALERGNILAHSKSMLTSVKGVFAGGDCVTGAATAVEAVAAGRKAAVAISRYLKGKEPVTNDKPFEITKGKLNEVSENEFVHVEHRPRQKMPKLSPHERKETYEEIELGFSEEAARREASRCLECGCKAQYDCDLRDLATEYEIESMTASRNLRLYPRDLSHPFVERDPNKCIACSRCVRICQEVQGVGALSLGYRVTTTGGTDGSLMDTTCVSCGQCTATCPVGALVKKNGLRPAYEVKTVCPYCGVGCGIYLGMRGGVIVNTRADFENPVSRGNLCVKGQFGHDFINHPDRLRTPLIKRDGKFVEATWDEALALVAAKFANYKGDQFGALCSARATNEENYVFQKFVRGVMGTNNIDHCARL